MLIPLIVVIPILFIIKRALQRPKNNESTDKSITRRDIDRINQGM